MYIDLNLNKQRIGAYLVDDRKSHAPSIPKIKLYAYLGAKQDIIF